MDKEEITNGPNGLVQKSKTFDMLEYAKTMVGAKIVDIGMADGFSEGGFSIDYILPGSFDTFRFTLGYTELGEWVERHDELSQWLAKNAKYFRKQAAQERQQVGYSKKHGLDNDVRRHAEAATLFEQKADAEDPRAEDAINRSAYARLAAQLDPEKLRKLAEENERRGWGGVDEGD